MKLPSKDSYQVVVSVLIEREQNYKWFGFMCEEDYEAQLMLDLIKDLVDEENQARGLLNGSRIRMKGVVKHLRKDLPNADQILRAFERVLDRI